MHIIRTTEARVCVFVMMNCRRKCGTNDRIMIQFVLEDTGLHFAVVADTAPFAGRQQAAMRLAEFIEFECYIIGW